MPQEEKNKILFEALSQYLPSKLTCHISDGENVDVDRVLTGITINGCYFDDNGAFYGWNSFDIKPYLRPMSSMTEEEDNEWRDWLAPLFKAMDYTYPESEKYIALAHSKSVDWLIINKIDYRGLIPIDLAIEVTEKNNPYKE